MNSRQYIIDKFVKYGGVLKPSEFSTKEVNILLGMISNYFDHPDDSPQETKLPIAFYEGKWYLKGNECKECNKFFFADKPYPVDRCEGCDTEKKEERKCTRCELPFLPERPTFTICNGCGEDLDEMMGFPVIEEN